MSTPANTEIVTVFTLDDFPLTGSERAEMMNNQDLRNALDDRFVTGLNWSDVAEEAVATMRRLGEL